MVTGKIVVKGKQGTGFVRLIDVRTGKILYATNAPVTLTSASSSTKSANAAKPAKGAPVAKGDGPPADDDEKPAKLENAAKVEEKPAAAKNGTTILGKSRTLPAGWTTKARFANDKSKEGGIRLGGKTDLIQTRDGSYLNKDFTLEVVVTITDEDHITFVGLGDTSNVNGYGEPKSVAMLRIHSPHLKSGVLLTKLNSTTDSLGDLTKPGTHLIRIKKEGAAVTFIVDVDNDGEVRTTWS